MTELAHRTSNGLDVSLLWSRHTGRLLVTVNDMHTEESFSLDAPSHRALDVYRHPFAYASRAPSRPGASGFRCRSGTT